MRVGIYNPAIPQSPRVVELVGPAGAGKTTLSRLLTQRSNRIRLGPEIELRKPRYIPVFVRSIPLLLPILADGRKAGRWFTWEETKFLVYLVGWPRLLRQEAAHGYAAILLDHGPVFKLATLNAFGPEGLKAEEFQPWWNKMFRRWASAIDLVVWLDAPDSILEERINSRDQRHAVKGKSGREVSSFLERYRTSYQHVLGKLEACGGPALIRFDSSQIPLPEIADQVLNALHSQPEPAGPTVEFA